MRVENGVLQDRLWKQIVWRLLGLLLHMSMPSVFTPR